MFTDYGEVLTVEETMEILLIGRNKIYELLRNRELQGFKLGNKWRIPRAYLSDFIIMKSKNQTSI